MLRLIPVVGGKIVQAQSLLRYVKGDHAQKLLDGRSDTGQLRNI